MAILIHQSLIERENTIMGYRNYDDVATRWVKVMLGDETTNYKHERMPIYGDRICSYGNHFTLAQPMREKGKVIGFVLNGDRYSNTTTKHQAAVRHAVERSGYPSVILPFSALAEAGIDPSSIRIVEVTQDRHEIIVEERDEMPSGAHWVYETEPIPGSFGWLHSRTKEWRDAPQWRKPEPYERAPQWELDGSSYEEHRAEMTAWRQREGEWEYQDAVHKQNGRKSLVSGPNARVIWQLVDVDGKLVYRTERYRHWLGEALVTGEVRYSKSLKCRMCGGKGEVEGYTVPRRVQVEGPAVYEWGYPVFGTIDVPSCAGCGGAGRVTVARRRRAYFLSAFDRNERRPSYFFCELPPKVKPTTVEEALETLKPDTVRLAEQMGRDVKRQGDIFAVPMPSVKTRMLTKVGKLEKGLPLFNTNHVVTEQVTTPDGVTWARGTLRHDPQWRRPDHARLTIGKEWHIILKNTVPVTA